MGLGIAGLSGVVGSVAFVRSKAAGHTYAESDVPHAPVALVLGAQVKPDGTPSAFLAARLDLAKRLYDAITSVQYGTAPDTHNWLTFCD